MAQAQGDHPPGDDVSSPPPLPRPPGPTGPPCRLAEHSGIEDTDAATAAQLVCTALARAGAPAQARYRVGIGKLGSVIILSLALEGETFGSTADTREMRLASVEDVPGAAPRIAAAMVHGTVIEDIEVPAPVVTSAAHGEPPPVAGDSAGDVVLDYCAAVRGILNDDQGGPLQPSGLRMTEALVEVRQSIDRNVAAKKGGSRRRS